MAINQNHLFEELNGIKCGIVEKMVRPDRVEFLKELLTLNSYSVVVAPTPPPKPVSPPPVPAPASVDGPQAAPPPPTPPPPALPETFTVGVTDITFNPINAIFGRLLRTRDGHVVTLAYWQQKDRIANDDIPYFNTK